MKNCMKNVCLITTIVLISMAVNEVALAAPPFGQWATTLGSDLVTWLTPFAALALIAIAVLCFTSVIHWAWFAAVFVGIAALFGKDQVVTWIRGIFGI